APFLAYGFRSNGGKAVVAYWLAARSMPGNVFPPLTGNLTLRNTGIEHPVLVDVVSGEISSLEWKKGTRDQIDSVPVRDSIMVIADETYFDWAVRPEAPSGLRAAVSGSSVALSWQVHGGYPARVLIERRMGGRGGWDRVAAQAASNGTYNDSVRPDGQVVSYRVRATNDAGESAYSNVVRVTMGR